MTLDKCIVLRIGTLTGCPLCRESHLLCRFKNPRVIWIWLLVGFHPATRIVQSTPADNTRKRVWQYIEKERKKLTLYTRLFVCNLLYAPVCTSSRGSLFLIYIIQLRVLIKILCALKKDGSAHQFAPLTQ